ncbi:MAG TPA: hypothetical protein ENJ32_07330 [Crenotrichaceae bacterium]|nr:hypothetical protein [Crenotrichaceae bacterium]
MSLKILPVVILLPLLYLGSAYAGEQKDLNRDAVKLDEIVLDEGNLITLRGRGDIRADQASSVNQTAALDNANVTSGVTGDNKIADGAFRDYSGIGTVVQNSGNNVIIQDTTTFNVMFVTPN